MVSLFGSGFVSGGEECCEGIVSRGCVCQSRLRLPRRTSGIVVVVMLEVDDETGGDGLKRRREEGE